MHSALALLTIEIDIDPVIWEIGGLVLTWHGVFTALGIGAGVYLALRVGERLGFLEDDIYTAALISIPAGIIGARSLYVIERWSTFSGNIDDIFRLNEGGISIYGAILGGLAGGLAYVWIRKLPFRRALDVAPFGMILGMAIGRIGDLINGEHFSEPTSLVWGVRYIHPDSPSFVAHPVEECIRSVGQPVSALCAQHPVVGYELIGDLLILGLLFLTLRFVHRDGVIFFGFLLLYSLMRFGVSELRLDSREIIAGLTTPQVTALFLIPIAIVGLLYSWRQPQAEAPASDAEGAG